MAKDTVMIRRNPIEAMVEAYERKFPGKEVVVAFVDELVDEEGEEWLSQVDWRLQPPLISLVTSIPMDDVIDHLADCFASVAVGLEASGTTYSEAAACKNALMVEFHEIRSKEPEIGYCERCHEETPWALCIKCLMEDAEADPGSCEPIE